ncbi:uncharacterized protein LOC128482984 [Spea bombifrons]|uniref:uncharacterized protein LOC128482984 n=1 Tax=Spea bombifrons TaxID=233779 RepID=UPI0023492738|nr:uncharacterized protein LOC128482984 [Spea bombifrons]
MRGLAWSATDDVFPTTEDEAQFLKQHNLTWSSLQQLKEAALGTREGMGRFTEFLRGTSGSHLFHFWMDCEEFKEHTGDLEANRDPEQSRLLSVRLFRFIHSKYQMSLGAENLEQIRVSQLNWGPTFHAFRRSQYDALRRLRSYWIPRFLIHQQRSQRRAHRSEAVPGSFPPANKPRSGPDHSESERKKKSKAPSEKPASGSDSHVGRGDVSREIRGGVSREILVGVSREIRGGASREIRSAVSREILVCVSREIRGAVSREIRGGVSREIRGAVSREIHGAVSREIRGGASREIRGAVSREIRGAVSREIRSDLLLRRLHSALRSDREAGGAFLHYLKRFESPQKARALLLWKDLGDLSERQSQQTHDERHRQAAGYIDDVHLGPNAFRAASEIPSAAGSFPAGTLLDWGSACQVALAALFQPWIRFLRYDIAVFLEFCAPTLFQEDKEPAGATGSHRQPGQKRNKNEREHGSFTLQGGKVHSKRRKERLIPPREASGHAGGHRQDAETLKEMLHHRAVYKVYRNVVQDTEEPEMLKALELLRALTETQGDRRLLGLVKKTLELDVLLSPYTKGLRKRLEKELLKGQIRRSTLEETTGFLSSLLAESFGKFWAEMSGRLKDYGVEKPGGEGWARIQPILKVIATKIVLKRLQGRKNQSCHPVKTLPSAEDIDLFNQALQVAAQGWPTPEVLHFLRHLQTHGPQEGLPLLENNLLCCLEVQKYKNIHHPMPDRGLVKRKVKVVKERFLLPQMNPVLQLSPELLQKALQEAEAAEQSELPPPTLFNHLQDALRDSLLPFWAGFRKTWVNRSPASAQRLPLLRVQQMLRRRLALFELEEIPTKTFHLPPLKNLPTRRFPSMVTFSFSISNGVKIMENSHRETPTPQDNRRMSRVGELPPISQMSLRTMQMAAT